MPKRYTINDMQVYAADFNGRCLSKEYIDSYTPLIWQCEKGHVWEEDFQIIRLGGWCRQCIKDEIKKEWLEKVKTVAEKKGGKCLSEKYTNTLTKLKFQCARGHQWLMTPSHLTHFGYWCVKCYRIEQSEKEFNKLKAIAAKKGGKCLSTNYKGFYSVLQWQCKKGHVWSVRAIQITRGRWCELCRKEKAFENCLKKLRALAERKGGKCLSEKYEGIHQPLQWQCSEGHIFVSRPRSITKGHWCAICEHKRALLKLKKYTVEQLQQYARQHGGKLLSREYIDTKHPLKWQCAQGHTWHASARIVERGTWRCPVCRTKGRGGFAKNF